jgi:hypothetical protein
MLAAVEPVLAAVAVQFALPAEDLALLVRVEQRVLCSVLREMAKEPVLLR